MIGGALRNAGDEAPEKVDAARMAQLYRRLAWTFRCEVSSFQRKKFASLSAEPNKAMNLNSYIGLMGGAYREEETPAGLFLTPVEEHEADLVVPESDYVLTIDADSVIMPEYCLRLVHLLESEEHQKVAVAQSPYSAFPGAATRLERIAGATTDLQHIIHQGMTYNNATFWVGANAILRKRALADIEEVEFQGPFKIFRYISDRTVIEDTESTIDLAAGGGRSTTTTSASPSPPRRRTSARWRSSATAGRTAACSSCRSCGARCASGASGANGRASASCCCG